MRDFIARMGVLGELMQFLWKRKLYWLIPMVITLALFAILMVVAATGPGGAFIYTLF